MKGFSKIVEKKKGKQKHTQGGGEEGSTGRRTGKRSKTDGTGL